MIFDTLDNAYRYKGLNKDADAILDALQTMTAENFKTGTIALGDACLKCVAMETRGLATVQMEAHRRDLDVACVLEGEEITYVCPTKQLKTITREYNEADDVFFAEMIEDTIAVHLTPGSFLILFPEDAHAPGCDVSKAHTAIKKVIGKAKV